MTENSYLQKAALSDLKDRFAEAHKLLWEGGKRDAASAFDEFTKILFAKVYDEMSSGPGRPLRFLRTDTRTPDATAASVRSLYSEACQHYPGVTDGEIIVDDAILARTVPILQDISLVQSDLDSPGRAFEAFLGDIFKAEMGQYLTPRPVVEMAVGMLHPTPDDTAIDPACGSGGFLLYILQRVIANYPGTAVGQYASHHLFGVELSERLAKLARVTMVLHGDGHSNIRQGNALLPPQAMGHELLTPDRYSIVATNPPFGAAVAESPVLGQFKLGSAETPRRAQKVELLFLERCINLLTPPPTPGRLGIVLPDSILTTVSLQYVREYILQSCKVLAVVSLPSQTFQPAGIGVKASFLLLERREASADPIGPAFMALPSYVGYDSTGRTDVNSLPVVSCLYEQARAMGEAARDEEPLCFMVEQSRLAARMDPFFHQPRFAVSIGTKMAKAKYPTKPLSEVVEQIAGGATPTAKGEAYVDATVGVPFLRIQNVREGFIDLADAVYIARDVHTGALLRSGLSPGDVLLTITGRVGTAAVVPPELRDANINQHIVRLRTKPDIVLPEYLEAVLNSPLCREQMERLATGSTRPALDYGSLRELRIPVPPTEVQTRLVATIAKLRAEVRDLDYKANLLREEIGTVVEREVLGGA